MKKWIMIPALAGVLVIGGIAMVGNAGHSLAATSKGLLTMEEAEAIALKTVDGNVTKIELDREKSRVIYEVEIKAQGVEYDLDIDAKTGKVLRTEKDDMDDDDYEDKAVTEAVSNGNLITEQAAIKIAMKQAKGTVTDVELDHEHGRVIYEIEIKDGTYEYDFDIDAISGEVLKFEKDRDDD